MIQCSLGDIEQLKMMRALSRCTFVEVSLPLDNYVDADTFTVTTDKEYEFVITSSEVYPADGSQVIFKATGVRKDQMPFLQLKPSSFGDEATAETILGSVGIAGGSKEKLSLVNLTLTQGQLAILIANSTAKTALVDFEAKQVKYYEDLYKEKAQEVPVKFRRIVTRVPQAGAYLYGGANEGVVPEGVTTMVPFGEDLNLPASVMKHFVENYNNLAALFAGLQSFVWEKDLELGASVLSPLTKSKAIVVAREEIWTTQGHTSIYYAV